MGSYRPHRATLGGRRGGGGGRRLRLLGLLLLRGGLLARHELERLRVLAGQPRRVEERNVLHDCVWMDGLETERHLTNRAEQISIL